MGVMFPCFLPYSYFQTYAFVFLRRSAVILATFYLGKLASIISTEATIPLTPGTNEC